MSGEKYTQETPEGIRDARIGYYLEHQRRGELANEALRNGNWKVDFPNVIFVRKFIREFCNGDDIEAANRFEFESVDALHIAMQEKADRVAHSFNMTTEELTESFPGIYL